MNGGAQARYIREYFNANTSTPPITSNAPHVGRFLWLTVLHLMKYGFLCLYALSSASPIDRAKEIQIWSSEVPSAKNSDFEIHDLHISRPQGSPYVLKSGQLRR